MLGLEYGFFEVGFGGVAYAHLDLDLCNSFSVGFLTRGFGLGLLYLVESLAVVADKQKSSSSTWRSSQKQQVGSLNNTNAWCRLLSQYPQVICMVASLFKCYF